MNHFIYMTTNLVNGKIYIGQRKVNRRAKTYLGSGTIFKLAVKKYGRENFSRVILEYATKATVDDKERFYIDMYNSTDMKIGYNLDSGGNSNKSLSEEHRAKLRRRTVSVETRSKMSDARRGKALSEEHRTKIGEAMKGTIHSENTKKKMSESGKKRILSEEQISRITYLGKANRGRIHSSDTRSKMSDAKRGIKRTHNMFGINSPRARKIGRFSIDDELLETYIGGRPTFMSQGYKPGTIYEVCKGHRNTHRGFIWKYLD